MCSLWQDSFIKMLTRPHGQWTHCSSSSCRTVFPFLLPSLSLNPSLCNFLSVPPSSLPLYTEISIGLDISCFTFLLTKSRLSFFFLCAVVSVLFKFNLNTFQLCMNQAVMNLIMLGHAAITELQHECACACVCTRYAWISYVHVFTRVSGCSWRNINGDV